MDTSDKVNSASTPSKFSVSPMSSKSDENDQNYPPSIANLNPRKPGETERIFKKKVLTERNEAMDLKSSENPSSEISNVDPKPYSGSRSNSMSQITLPYDPLTNYLSPRPKFLRYKPSRRREIFLRQQNVEEGNCGIGGGLLKTVAEDSQTSSSEEEKETGKQEKKKLEENDAESCEIDEKFEDDGEGDEEGRGWSVKALFKFLLVIASLVLSTSYIISMNNTPTLPFEVSGAFFRSGFCPILNHTGEFGSSLVMESPSGNGSNFWDEQVTVAASKRDSEGVSQFTLEEDATNRGFMEETEILNEGKAVYGDLVQVEYTEQVEEAREEKPLTAGIIAEEIAEGEENGVQFLELAVEVEDDGYQQEGKESEISNAIAVPSEMPEEDEITEASMPSINVFDEDNLSGILAARGNEITLQMEAVEMEEAGDWKMSESNKGEGENFVCKASKITILERITNGISSFVENLKKLKSELIELMHTETESVLKVVLGLSVASAILTCLVLSFQFKKKKDDEKEPAISASVKPPLLQSPVAEAEKIITREDLPSIKPTCDLDRPDNDEPIRHVDSFKTLSSFTHSRDEVESFKEFYHHEAPTVQFLGELVVGEISNSLKNRSGLKSRMIEAEGSSFPVVSVEEKPVSKNMNSGPEQALSEFSTTTSPSYGSFPTKKKIVKKEVGGDVEVKSIPTPVRRSTRIRNRIVSP